MGASQTNTSPWIRFELSNWDILVREQIPRLFKKNQLIFQQEQDSHSVYLLKSGRVRITSYQLSGMEKQFYIAETGCLFGESSCMSGHQHSTSAVAIVDSMVYCIPAAEFLSAMQSNWVLAQFVLRVVCHKNDILSQHILDLSFAQALQRVCRVLLNLGLQYGEKTSLGLKISIRFTHQDVSNISTASRVTVSNIFNSLSAKGLLKKENGLFYLTDIPELNRYADGEAEL